MRRKTGPASPAAAGQVSSPSGGHRLPPMAPRVVLRQPQGSAQAFGAGPGTGTGTGNGTVQRVWQAARPGPGTSALPGNGMSGHRRGTTESGEEASSQPPSPAPPGGVNGGGPSATSGVSAATQPDLARVDVDRLIEAIEERVLAEIERRGGRYAGLF